MDRLIVILVIKQGTIWGLQPSLPLLLSVPPYYSSICSHDLSSYLFLKQSNYPLVIFNLQPYPTNHLHTLQIPVSGMWWAVSLCYRAATSCQCLSVSNNNNPPTNIFLLSTPTLLHFTFSPAKNQCLLMEPANALLLFLFMMRNYYWTLKSPAPCC